MKATNIGLGLVAVIVVLIFGEIFVHPLGTHWIFWGGMVVLVTAWVGIRLYAARQPEDSPWRAFATGGFLAVRRLQEQQQQPDPTKSTPPESNRDTTLGRTRRALGTRRPNDQARWDQARTLHFRLVAHL